MLFLPPLSPTPLSKVTSLPGNLLLFDNGTLAASLGQLSGLSSVGGSLAVFGHLGLGPRGMSNLQPLSGIRVGDVEGWDVWVELREAKGLSGDSVAEGSA